MCSQDRPSARLASVVLIDVSTPVSAAANPKSLLEHSLRTYNYEAAMRRVVSESFQSLEWQVFVDRMWRVLPMSGHRYSDTQAIYVWLWFRCCFLLLFVTRLCNISAHVIHISSIMTFWQADHLFYALLLKSKHRQSTYCCGICMNRHHLKCIFDFGFGIIFLYK